MDKEKKMGRELNWRREWQPTPVFSPGEFHGQRSFVGYCPWGRKESDMTEHTHTHGQNLFEFCKNKVLLIC